MSIKKDFKKLSEAFESLTKEQVKFLVYLEMNKGMITRTLREMNLSYYVYSKWRKNNSDFLDCMNANNDFKKDLVRDKIFKIAMKEDDEDLLKYLNNGYNKEDLAKMSKDITEQVINVTVPTILDMYSTQK